MRLAVGRQDRLGTDGGRIKQDVRAEQRHRPRGLREPLIPADADANCAISRPKHAKTRVSGRKIELFLIIMIVRDVRLAIHAKQAAVRVDHRNGVIGAVAIPLIKAHGNHNRTLLCDRLHPQHRRVLRNRLRIVEVIIPALLAKIGSLKQLRQEYNLRTFVRRLAHQRFRVGEVFGRICRHLHLHCRNGDFAHWSTPFEFVRSCYTRSSIG